MNRDEAEAAHHAAFLDKQERVFQRRQQVNSLTSDILTLTKCLDTEYQPDLKKCDVNIINHVKAWEKHISAGRTCRLGKCGFNSKNHDEFEEHLSQHKEDLKRRLICNQVGCLNGRHFRLPNT